MNLKRIRLKAVSFLLSAALLLGGTPLVAASARTTHPFTVVAGSPGVTTYGYSGDTNPAVNAALHTGDLGKMALDSQGNLYIADSYNHAVRKVDAVTGKITTVWLGDLYNGINYHSFSGIAVDTNDDVYISDIGYTEIWKYDHNTGIVTPVVGSTSGLGRPFGICFGPDNCLYITDQTHYTIEKWDGSTLTAVVGQTGHNGDVGTFENVGQTKNATDACLNRPMDVTFDSNGNMYIADGGNNKFYKVANGKITVLAGTGNLDFNGTGHLATQTDLASPNAVRTDSSGNVYLGIGFGAWQVLRIDPSDNKIYSFAGKGTYGCPQTATDASDTKLGNPTGLTVGTDGTVYVCDDTNHVSKVETKTVTDPTVPNASNNTVTVNPTIVQPGGNVMISAAGDGQADATNVETSQRYVAKSWSSSESGKGGALDSNSHAVYTPSGTGAFTITVTYQKQTYTNGSWTDAAGATASKTAGLVVSENYPVAAVAGNGTAGLSGNNGDAKSALLNQPFGMAFDSQGNLYIADSGNNRIRKINLDGRITTVAGGGTLTADHVNALNAKLNMPQDVALDAQGNLYIADTGNNKIRKVSPNGIITTVAGSGTYGFAGDGSAATDAAMRYPAGIDVDASGNLYIADFYNHRVRKVDTNGIIQTIVGSDQEGYSTDGSLSRLGLPSDVKVDKSGNIYIADVEDKCVFLVDAGLTTMKSAAGRPGGPGNDGDGFQANLAGLGGPEKIALDASGNLYISDNTNERIRKVYTNGIITTYAGGGTSTNNNVSATAAKLNHPEGLAVDADGNLYFSECDANSIREVVRVAKPSPSPSPSSSSSSSTSTSTPTKPSLPSTVTDAKSGVTADLSSAALPAGVTSVSLSITQPSQNDRPAADFRTDLLAAQSTGVINIPQLCNISLLDQNGNPVVFTGSVTVTIPIPAGVRGTPHVFQYESATKTFTDRNAKVENGTLVFTTASSSDFAIAGVGNAIVLDTLTYQMPVTGQYQIGLRLPGTKAATVKYHSTSDSVATVVKLGNGNYQVIGKGTGTAWIMFDVYDSKNHLLTHASVRVDVIASVKPHGNSTRQIGIF